MAERQRRARESADRRPELGLAVTARGCLLAELHRLAAVDGELCFALQRGLHPAAVHVRTVTGVLIVPRFSGSALTGVILGSVLVCTERRFLNLVAVSEVKRSVLTGSVDSGQLLVRCIAIVGVRKQRLGGVEAEAQSEHARGEAAQDWGTILHLISVIRNQLARQLFEAAERDRTG
jgi:hypothetical protein